ncbi:class I SAM-dependent methyltransferase [Thermoflavimicrobium dichotomicum]|uniref:tRNA (Cmo5U34)-methyltransferase n=1 Tax=Thermoflavimicrobium dichotomicum TaxID=46223 RepID=A0A1I3Q6P8_9BACL|nr:class I SAM-dependent methyltransferase [Thermoflavimicrobium dichotomicum]SFJ29558.1 tRNA (cmo5U34)-methyltransferase [Thermoflavimicrobium dichotomicum]
MSQPSSNDERFHSKVWEEDDTQVFLEMGELFTPRRTEIRESIIRMIPKKKEDAFVAVDIGCGQGWLSEAVLRQFPHAEVIALDGSEQMLNRAQQLLEKYQERVSFQKFRLENPNWISSLSKSVDCFLSSLVIHHLNDQEKRVLFKQLYQSLNPNGVLLIADLVRPRSDWQRNYWEFAWEEEVKRQSIEKFGDLRGYDAFIKEEWNLYRHPDDPVDKPSSLYDQLQWLTEAGFQGVDVFWLKAGHAVFGGFKYFNQD